MKPLNREIKTCNPISSNCVIWDGPTIDCLKLCNGDSVSDVVYALATKLCGVLDELKVSAYDLSCFDLTSCAPKDFTDLIQLLIDRICALEGLESPVTGGTKGCPDCVVNMAPCFYYNDPKTGDQITTSQLSDYVTLIGNLFCDLLAVQGTQGRTLDNHGARITALETKPAPVLNLPSIVPDCVLPKNPTRLDIVVQALEQQFCELRSATGTAAQIFQGIAAQPAGLNNQRALGTSGGNVSSLPNWVPTVQQLADSVENLWVMVADLRSAVTNIQLNCCPSPCNGVAIQVQASMPNLNQFILYFTGTIPAGLVECDINGTLFTIADQSGHLINVRIPLVANMNNPSGYPIVINPSPLNTSDNFTISSDVCFKENSTGTICQRCIEYVFVNTSSCPAVTFIAGQTTISFSFSHSSGQKTYTVSLFDSTGNSVIQSQVFPETNPATVSGTFSGLTNGTTYKVRVSITGSNGLTTVCPFTAVSTLPTSCPPPSDVTAVIIIS